MRKSKLEHSLQLFVYEYMSSSNLNPSTGIRVPLCLNHQLDLSLDLLDSVHVFQRKNKRPLWRPETARSPFVLGDGALGHLFTFGKGKAVKVISQPPWRRPRSPLATSTSMFSIEAQDWPPIRGRSWSPRRSSSPSRESRPSSTSTTAGEAGAAPVRHKWRSGRGSIQVRSFSASAWIWWALLNNSVGCSTSRLS